MPNWADSERKELALNVHKLFKEVKEKRQMVVQY